MFLGSGHVLTIGEQKQPQSKTVFLQQGDPHSSWPCQVGATSSWPFFLLREGRGVKILLLSYSHLPPGLGTNQELQSKLQAKSWWQLGRFCNWHSKISVGSPHWDSLPPLQILPPGGKQSRRAQQRSRARLQTNVHRCCICLELTQPLLQFSSPLSLPFFTLDPHTAKWCIATSPHTY